VKCKCKNCGKNFEAEPSGAPRCHRLLVGDSTNPEDPARVMGGTRAALCLTSPPYPGAEMWNAGEERGLKDNIGRLQALCLAVLKSACELAEVVCWNVADVPIGGQTVQYNSAQVIEWCRAHAFLVRPLVWDKGIPNPLPPLAFRRKPVVPHLTHEWLFVIYPRGWHPREKESSLLGDSEWQMRSVWTIAPAHASEVGHQAPYPVELARRCLALFSLPGDTVLDPFLGSGTTTVAAEQTGRTAFGIDVSPGYCAIALERLSQIGLEPRITHA
jgi:DNA modification methylase